MKSLTVLESAQELRISSSCVYSLCSQGLLRHYRVGIGRGVLRIPEDAINEYRQSRMSLLRNGAVVKTAPQRKPNLKHLSLS